MAGTQHHSGTLYAVGHLQHGAGPVDSVEGNFFFDTGAPQLLLNSRHFSRPGQAPAIRNGGVTGAVQVLGTAKIDTFQLDNLLKIKASADIIDLTHLELAKKIDLVGLIGYAVFKEYEILFDYAAGLLIFIRTTAKGARFENLPRWEYQPGNSFPLSCAGHVAVVRLQFGTKTTQRFAIDSGAEQNMLNIFAGKAFLNVRCGLSGLLLLMSLEEIGQINTSGNR